MKKKTLFQSSNVLLRALIFIILPSIFFIAGCKDQDEPNGTGYGTKDLKLPCARLSHDDIKSWVDSGWTKSGDPASIKKMLLQLYSTNPAMIKSDAGLIVYPGASVTDVKVTGQKVLTIDTTCAGLVIKEPVIFSNNEANIDSLHLFNKDGRLKDFDYLLFTPKLFTKDPRYISFSIEMITGGKSDPESNGGSWPCPPYCGEPD
jgi:hypothetical protein